MSLLASAEAKNDKEKVMELKNQLQKERVRTLDKVVALGRLKVKIYGDIDCSGFFNTIFDDYQYDE